MEQEVYTEDPQQEEQQPAPKLSVPEFASKIKTKYPQYKDVPDDELVAKIINKYPQYKDSVELVGGDKKKVEPPVQSYGLGKAEIASIVPKEEPKVSEGFKPTNDEFARRKAHRDVVAQNLINGKIPSLKEFQDKIPKYAQVNQPVSTDTNLPEEVAMQNDSMEDKTAKNEIAAQTKDEAIENTAKKILAQKGIINDYSKPLGVLQYAQLNEEKNKLKEAVENGDAVVTRKKGEAGLNRTIGWWEGLSKGWNEATRSSDEADEFVNNMDAQEKLNFLAKQQEENKHPEYLGEKGNGVGSMGEFVGSNAPFLGKAVAGTILGTAATALAPETGGISTAALPTAMAFLFTAPDMVNQGAMGEIMRRYETLKRMNPDKDELALMQEAEQGKWAGGGAGLATNALLMGTGIKMPVSATGKAVIGKAITKALESSVHMGATTAAVEGVKQLEGNLEGIKSTPEDIAKSMATTFEENATVGLLLHTMTQAVNGAIKLPKALKSAIKYGLKDANPAELGEVLKMNEAQGVVPEGTAEKVVGEVEAYKKALSKTADDLPPEVQASVAGLIEAKDKIIAERETKDETQRAVYDEKIAAINEQINKTIETGKPYEHEVNELSGETYGEESKNEPQKGEPENISQPIELSAEVTPKEEVKSSTTVSGGEAGSVGVGGDGFKQAGEKARDTKDATHIGRWMLDNSQKGDVVRFQDGGYEVTEVNTKKDGTKELVLTPFEFNEDGSKDYNNSGVKIITEQSIKNGSNLFENAYTNSKGERVVEQSTYEPVEQSLKETPQAGSVGVGGDVEATAKALENVDLGKMPNVTFHGSKNKDLIFGKPKEGKDRKSNMQLDFGTHFTSEDYASFYTGDKGKKYPAIIDLKNPLDLTQGNWWKDDPNFEAVNKLIKDLKLEKEYGSYDYYDKNGDKQQEVQSVSVNAHKLNNKIPKKVSDALKANGFDGIIYEPYHPQGGKYYEAKPKSFIVLDNSAIKEVNPKNIAEAYHKAKADGTNPELVKAVEQSLKEQPKADIDTKKEAGSVGVGVDGEFNSKGGNKIVDDKGEPLVLYHGTGKGVQAEDLKQSGQAGDYGEGIYFATDKREAEQRNSENIIEANVKSDNHLVIGSKEYFDGIYKTLEKKYGSVIPQHAIGAEAKKAGYTSIEVERPEGKWIIAFDGAKIQSLKEQPKADIDTKKEAGSVGVGVEAKLEKPSAEQQLKDIEEGNMVTFEYKNESEVPEVFKDKISSKGEVNGKTYVKVTMAKSLADYHLKEQSIKETPKSENIQNEPIKEGAESTQPITAETKVNAEASPVESGKSAEAGESGGGKKPPVEENAAPEEKGRFKEKGILNRIFNSENVPEHSKKGFEEKGLKYEPQTHEEAERIGKTMVDEYGIDDAVTLAETAKFKGGVNSAIFAEVLNRLYKQEQDAKTPQAKLEAAKQFAEVGIRYDEFGRGQGRDISQIAHFYKKSPLGVKLMEEARRREDFAKFSKNKEQTWREFFDEMTKEPEFDKIVKEKISEELKKERAEARKKRIDKIDKFFDDAINKLNDGGAAYSSIIPITPKVLQSALKGMKEAYHAGESIAKIIEDAVDYISEKMGSKEWDVEKFKKDWEAKLGSEEKYKKAVEEISEEKRQKLLDRFRKKLKGLTEKEKDDVIRKSFKKLVENGALEYEDFKKIIAETLGYGEMTPEQAKKITDLVTEINAVDDLATKLRENERNEESLKKYQDAKKKAEKSATELGKMVFNRPDIVKRLLSIMQLNTLGIPSLINNPIFNVFNQATVRLPRSIIMTAIDYAIYGGGKLFGKDYKPENNIIQAQREFYKKLGYGSRQSVEQLFTGLTNKDYFQKEVYASQIHPTTSVKELWSFAKGETKLTKAQVIDKTIQATAGVPAEVVARVLNIGDKPQRFAAEGAQAATFAHNLGLQGIDYKLFMEFPKEEAYRKLKKDGFSDEAAMKKAEEIQERIIKEGEESTFQQDNLLNDAITAAFKPFGKAGDILKTLNMPFVKIPLNAFWSVYNLANPEVAMLQSMIYGVKALKSKSPIDIQQSKKWFAHAVTGMAWMSIVGGMAKSGIINSPNADDTTKKEREGEQFYEQQNSVNISKLLAYMNGEDPSKVKNGLNVDLKWLGNMGILMGYQAQKLEAMTPEQRENGIDYMEDMMSNLKLTALDFMDKGVFSNTNAMFTAINKGGSFLDNYLINLMNMGANIVQPAAYAQISRAQLPYYSKVKADSFLEQLDNNFSVRSSLYRNLTGKYPPSKIGIWGDTLDKKDNTFMRLFGISRANDDNFAQPIYEDYKKSHNTKFFPSAIKPEIKQDGATVKLNTNQVQQLETLVGQQRKALVAPYINDMATFEGSKKRYSDLKTDEEKTDKLQLLYDLGYQAGVKQFFAIYPELKPKEKTTKEQNEEDEKAMQKEDLKDANKEKLKLE